MRPFVVQQTQPVRPSRHFGFTLIELLIAITIFIILTTLTIATFNLNIGSERITAASRQVQGMLEGARSRAFKMQRPVGVRFVFDPNFPAEINSLVYIGAVENPGGGSYQTGRLRFVDLVPGTPGVLDGEAGIQQLIPYPGSIAWSELNTLQLLRSGVRIRIPAGTGKWYTVDSQNFLTPNSTVMRLTETPLDVASYGLLSQDFSSNTGKVYDYEIDLSTVMAPLAGEDPAQLPPGTVIDLRSSKVPSNWYLNRWVPNTACNAGAWVAGLTTNNGLKVYRADNSGTSGGSEPNWSSATANGATVNDNGIVWRCYQTPLLDVVFTPQGTLMGSVAAEGLLHFTIAETRDTREIFEDGSIGIPAWDTSDRDGDGESPDHRGSFRVVTVFGASGAVNVSPIDLTDVLDQAGAITPDDDGDGKPDGNGTADNLFRFAIEGATAK